MLSKLSVRMRLILLLIVTSTALVAIGLLGYTGMALMNTEIDHVYLGGMDEVERLSSIRSNLTWQPAVIQKKISDGSLKADEGIEQMKQVRAKGIEEWNSYVANQNYFAEDIKKQWDKKVGEMNELLKQPVQTVSLEAIMENLNQIIALHTQDTKNDYREAKEKYIQYKQLMLFGLFLSLTLSVIVAYLIIRSITKPLELVVENVNRISQGDTTMIIDSKEGGELGKVINSVKNMIFSTQKMSTILEEFASGNLSSNVSPRSEHDTLGISLNGMSTQMRSMIGDIKSEVNVLTSSSQEILSSLSQLSSGSAESATAVTETTTTLEELKQTATVSSEKAKDVLSNAEETLVTVKESEKSVQSVIQDMNQIKDRMQIISESILKLSEKSLAIAEIMDSVNDIAEQSNLLAVNAAIEAAKAGEQGRSFGVVAQEIRTLAEQSKGATIQVRSLLNEIQNATNSAVLATEQGSKAVAKGVEQSTRTTQSIKELIGSMNRVTQSANQIVLSNQQQSVGTEQIAIAMSNINEAAQQHVERLREIELAVSTLNKVSTSLKGMTDQYTINNVDNEEKLPRMLDKLQKKAENKKYYEHTTK